jgi:predicted GIY-YIG superfamily endonuclease
MWNLYELYDIFGNCVYVGITSGKLERRLRDHVRYHKDRKFYGQQLTIIGISRHPTKREAMNVERELKLSYGMHDTEWEYFRAGGRALKGRIPKNMLSPSWKDFAAKGGKATKGLPKTTFFSKGGKAQSLIIRICPTCDLSIRGNVYFLHIKKCQGT